MKTWPRLNLNAILAAPRPELEFVLPNLLKGSVGLLAGPGGVGKTNFLLQLGIELALGQPPLGGHFPTQPPRKVSLMLAEEHAAVMACRLHDHVAALGDVAGQAAEPNALPVGQLMERLVIVPAGGLDTNICNSDDTTLFDELVSLTAGSDLIVLDPIRRFHDGDENSSADMTRLVQKLEVLAARASATVLCAHHMNKSAATAEFGEVQQAARGSSALTDGVRWQANLLPLSVEAAKRHGIAYDDRAGYVRLLLSKSNYGPPLPELLLRRTANGSFEAAHPSKSTTRTSKQHGSVLKVPRYV